MLSPVDEATLSLNSFSSSVPLSSSVVAFDLPDCVALFSGGKPAACSAVAPACAALVRFTPPPGRLVRDAAVGAFRMRIVGRGLPTPFPAPGASRAGSLSLCCAESGVALLAVAPGESPTRFVPPACCCGLVASCSIGELITQVGKPSRTAPYRRGDVVRASWMQTPSDSRRNCVFFMMATDG